MLDVKIGRAFVGTSVTLRSGNKRPATLLILKLPKCGILVNLCIPGLRRESNFNTGKQMKK